MPEVRMLFKKTGRAIFLSHLDLMHVLQRSFLRAGVDCAYSSGFNPHMQLTLPIPLPLGHEGQNELLEANLIDQIEFSELPGRINPFLPEGIDIIEAFEPIMKPSEMAYADYFVEIDLGGTQTIEIQDYLNSGEVVVLKRTKRGEALANIAPDIYSARAVPGGLELLLTASQSANLNPAFAIRAIDERFELLSDSRRFVRRNLLNREFQPFK